MKRVLDDVSPADVLLMEAQTREIFARAVEALKNGTGAAAENALDVGPFY